MFPATLEELAESGDVRIRDAVFALVRDAVDVAAFEESLTELLMGWQSDDDTPRLS